MWQQPALQSPPEPRSASFTGALECSLTALRHDAVRQGLCCINKNIRTTTNHRKGCLHQIVLSTCSCWACTVLRPPCLASAAACAACAPTALIRLVEYILQPLTHKIGVAYVWLVNSSYIYNVQELQITYHSLHRSCKRGPEHRFSWHHASATLAASLRAGQKNASERASFRHWSVLCSRTVIQHRTDHYRLAWCELRAHAALYIL